MTTLSTLKDLALSSQVVTNYTIVKDDLSDVLSNTVGLSSIENISTDLSIGEYTKKDQIGLSVSNNKLFVYTDGSGESSVDIESFLSDNYVTSGEYEVSSKSIILHFNKSSTTVTIPVSGMIHEYNVKSAGGLCVDNNNFYVDSSDEGTVVMKDKSDISSNMTLGDMFKEMAKNLGHNWVDVQ